MIIVIDAQKRNLFVATWLASGALHAILLGRTSGGTAMFLTKSGVQGVPSFLSITTFSGGAFSLGVFVCHKFVVFYRLMSVHTASNSMTSITMVNI